MKLKRISLFAALACCALPCTTMAQNAGPVRGWYAGLDFGQSKLEQDSPVAGVVARDDTSSAWGLRVGYRFAKFFALEGGYTDIGDFTTTYVPFCGVTPPSNCPTGEARTSIDGIFLNAVGIWPLAEHFQLKGSLGTIYRKLDARIQGNSGTGASNGWSDEDTAFSFGFGVAVPINANFEIDLDYTLYREIGLGLSMDNNFFVVDESESTVVMLGLRYTF